MGDHLGSPRVTPLFLALFGPYGYYSGLPLVVPIGSALPIAIGAGRSSIRASDRQITGRRNRASEISPPFSATWKIPSIEDDRRKRQAFWTAGWKVIGGNAWGGCGR